MSTARATSKIVSTARHPVGCAHARRAVHKTSEFLGIAQLATCIWLQRRQMFPLPRITEDSVNSVLRLGVATLLFVLGVLLIRATHAELATYKQPHEPGRPTTRLVTTGPFEYSRHPTYLACVLFLTPSTALFLNNTWILVTWPLGMTAFQYVMIKPEEDFLHQQFPLVYQRYCQQTNQWYGRKKAKS